MEQFDLTVIGAASAGMPAAIYAKRFGMSTLLIGAEVGGLLNESNQVENYPGFSSIAGLPLMLKFKEHVESLDIPLKEEWVKEIRKDDDDFIITTDKSEIKTRSIIYTAGAKHRHLGVPGEAKLSAKGVSYCATCDAAFFRGVPVIVVGGGDAAAQAADQLAQHCTHVYVAVRKDHMRAEPINQKRIENNEKITILYETEIKEIIGENAVKSVKLSKPFNSSDELAVEGVFIHIGADPQSQLAEKLGVELEDTKEIKIDPASRTNIKRFYAAGDVANRPYKQTITGAAEGVIAAFSAFDDLHK